MKEDELRERSRNRNLVVSLSAVGANEGFQPLNFPSRFPIWEVTSPIDIFNGKSLAPTVIVVLSPNYKEIKHS